MTEPIVEIFEGKLRGVVKKDRNGQAFYGFQGIPYAKPPIGELRFKAPLPAKHWYGIRDAIEEGNECLAKHFDEPSGSEDCLFLNVYTKEINTPKLKPVMVWIHGGGFTTGSSSTQIYGPEHLLTEDIILVTFNYRLGILGFLSVPDPEVDVPGNAGLKDMILVLKWVQRNIKQFGGDTDNVTIFGESAGGSSVHYLCLSPLAKGLFHKAIAQSGTATNGWALANDHSFYTLAELTGIHSNDCKVIFKHLQSLSEEEIGNVIAKIPELNAIGMLRLFGPVIEKPSKQPAFLSSHPTDIMKSGNYSKVPMIIGSVSREGMFIRALCVASHKLNVLDNITLIPANFNQRINSNIYNNSINKIKKFYFGDKDPFLHKDLINKLYTDNYFLYEIYKNARLHLETNTCPMYFYRFSYDTELNFLKKLYGLEDPGVAHADDCAYIFRNLLVPEPENGTVADIAIRRTVRLWTNFAKYGKPTLGNQDPLLPVDWQPMVKGSMKTYDIGEEIKLYEDHPDEKYMKFWDKIGETNPFTSKL